MLPIMTVLKLAHDDIELLTSSELMLCWVVHVIRVITIAVKYGFMPQCAYETITQSENREEAHAHLVSELLVTWVNPTDEMLRAEIDKAASDRGFEQDQTIQFDTAKFCFATSADADRLLNR